MWWPTAPEGRQPWYWKPAVKKTIKLTRELPCPSCGHQNVETNTGANAGFKSYAWCPDCGASWGIHDGCPLDCWEDPLPGARPDQDAWNEWDVHDPWPLVDALLDAGTTP